DSLSLFGFTRTGDGLSTGRKEKLGESALDNDSGVPTELIVPGSGLDRASNLRRHYYLVGEGEEHSGEPVIDRFKLRGSNGLFGRSTLLSCVGDSESLNDNPSASKVRSSHDTYLDDDVEGVVTDMVALISLIIGALLDRFRLTIGQSTSMIVGVTRGSPRCLKT
ncbi:hypothetical protein ALC57_01978, partial [Trachymyrmex cornetzi]